MINNTKLLESFRSECTVIDFLKQDEHWVGSEKFAIVTDLSQAELQNKYGLLLGEYTPFVILTTYQAEEIKAFDREAHRQEMCEAGVNVKVIQDTLGHKDISTTLNIYTDVTKELKKSEFEGLDSFFSGDDKKTA